MIGRFNNLGNGLKFVSSNARQVNIPHHTSFDFALSADFSFAAWLTLYQPDNVFGTMLFSKTTQGSDRGYFFNASPTFAGISLRDGVNVFRRRIVSPGINLGQRFHILSTKTGNDPNAWRTYINGVDILTATVVNGNLVSINNPVSGKINSYEGISGACAFDLFDLQCFAKGLNPDEALRVYYAQGAVPSDLTGSCRGHWTFDHKKGARVTDYSGNNNHGTLINYLAADTTPGSSNFWIDDNSNPIL